MIVPEPSPALPRRPAPRTEAEAADDAAPAGTFDALLAGTGAEEAMDETVAAALLPAVAMPFAEPTPPAAEASSPAATTAAVTTATAATLPAVAVPFAEPTPLTEASSPAAATAAVATATAATPPALSPAVAPVTAPAEDGETNAPSAHPTEIPAATGKAPDAAHPAAPPVVAAPAGEVRATPPAPPEAPGRAGSTQTDRPADRPAAAAPPTVDPTSVTAADAPAPAPDAPVVEAFLTLASAPADAPHRTAAPTLHAMADPRATCGQIAVALVEADDQHLEIRLDPPELGRVHIHLTTSESGGVQALVAAHRPETQEFLRRHADTLAEELASAGYGDVRLDFGGGDATPRREERPSSDWQALGLDPAGLAPATATLPRTALSGALDVRL
jgi:flagellar hook-length control protein FliK